MSARGGGALFLDTILSRDSWAAVLGGTGAVLAAVDHARWRAGTTPLPRFALRVTMPSPQREWGSVW